MIQWKDDKRQNEGMNEGLSKCLQGQARLVDVQMRLIDVKFGIAAMTSMRRTQFLTVSMLARAFHVNNRKRSVN